MTIDKETVSLMPVVEFGGKIIDVRNGEECEKAVAWLRQQSPIGFDTETKPSFQKGVTHKVALMQLSTADTCYLFHLAQIENPRSLLDFLADGSVTKIGISIKDDTLSLNRRFKSVSLKGFIDIQSIIKNYGIEEMSLRKIYAILFKQKISKAQRLTNWESDHLTEAQKRYAAIDAWACLEIYRKLGL
jgi:ribonuclease D